MTIIRPALATDFNAITAIYSHHVLHGTATFETEPPSEAEMLGRCNDVWSKGLPYLVAEDGGRILGFAYCNWFKPRPAFRFSAENSIYLASDATGRGIGRLLLSELLSQAERSGVRRLIAVIGDSDNAASIGLHRSSGFAHVGVLRSCGWKFGRWLDVVMMERSVGNGDLTPPDADAKA